MDILCVFLYLVALEDLKYYQVNINNIFTESTLKEDIYIAILLGIQIERGQTLKIDRNFYKLKQAARDWYQLYTEGLAKLGFIIIAINLCLFVYREYNIILLLYINNISIILKDFNQLFWFKAKFSKLYKTKDLGEIEKILSIKIKRNKKNRIIKFN